MIRVEFDPGTLVGKQKKWWDNWTIDAQKATEDAIKEWEDSDGKTKLKLDGTIWKKLKEWLLENVFNEKCAYCETKLFKTQAPEHAEHFRPKNGISNGAKNKKRYGDGKTRDPKGNEIDHPGYIWLAYNWKNLVPSCNNCNTGPGKKSQFPINNVLILAKKMSNKEVKHLTDKGMAPRASEKWKGFYYLDPDHLDAEEDRLLLHPYRDEPRDHIGFGPKGLVHAKKVDGKESEKGIASIAVFALHRDNLRRSRELDQNKAKSSYMAIYNGARYLEDDKKKAAQIAQDAFQKLISNNTPYFAAIEDAFKFWVEDPNLHY